MSNSGQESLLAVFLGFSGFTDLADVCQKEKNEDRHEHDGGQCIHLRIDAELGHGVDLHGQSLDGAVHVEIADQIVIDREGKGQKQRRQNAGKKLRNNDQCYGLKLCRAKILRGFGNVFVELLQLGRDGEHGKRHAERDMCQKQRELAFLDPQKREEEHEGNTSDKLRHNVRDIGHIHGQGLDLLAEVTETQAGEDGDQSRCDGRDRGDLQRGQKRREQLATIRSLKERCVVFEGKTAPYEGLRYLVERKDDQDNDRQIQEKEYQSDVNIREYAAKGAAEFALIHSTIPPPLSPKSLS